jgi:hypothetical protein
MLMLGGIFDLGRSVVGVSNHRSACLAALLVVATFSGCGEQPAAAPQAAAEQDNSLEAEIAEMIGKLDEADQKLALEQKFCAVQSHERLGSMGVPAKLELDGQTIFLCCEGCEKSAKADPEKTLARVAELKAANATTN